MDAALRGFGLVPLRFRHRLLDVGRHDDRDDAPVRLSDRQRVLGDLPKTGTIQRSDAFAFRTRLFGHLVFVQRSIDATAMADARTPVADADDGQ